MGRRITITAALLALLALGIWYEPGMIAGTADDAPAVADYEQCAYSYAPTALGWEPWELVEDCW